MGIFTNQVMDTMNGYSSPISVQEAEGYDDGVYSAQIAQIVGLQNEMSLFEAGVKSDMQACMMITEGVDESDVLGFSEGVLGDMFNRIKEFFKKLWAKIKAIFTGFIARIEAKFGKNNKEFINKYKKELIGKDYTDFEVKYRKPTGKWLAGFSIDHEENYFDAGHIASTIKDGKSQLLDHFDKEKFEEDLCKSAIGTACTVNEFEKEAFDLCFEDEDNHEINSGFINTVMSDMLSFKKARSEVKKTNDSMNKAISQIIKLIEKEQNATYKLAPGSESDNKDTERKFTVDIESDGENRYKGTSSDTKGTAHTIKAYDKNSGARGESVSTYQRALGHMSTCAGIVQKVVLKITSTELKMLDFNNKQNRMILGKAVAYKRKEESAIMEEAMAELAIWEADY